MDGVTTGAQNSSRLAAAGAAAGQRPKLSLSAALEGRGAGVLRCPSGRRAGLETSGTDQGFRPMSQRG